MYRFNSDSPIRYNHSEQPKYVTHMNYSNDNQRFQSDPNKLHQIESENDSVRYPLEYQINQIDSQSNLHHKYQSEPDRINQTNSYHSANQYQSYVNNELPNGRVNGTISQMKCGRFSESRIAENGMNVHYQNFQESCNGRATPAIVSMSMSAGQRSMKNNSSSQPSHLEVIGESSLV